MYIEKGYYNDKNEFITSYNLKHNIHNDFQFSNDVIINLALKNNHLNWKLLFDDADYKQEKAYSQFMNCEVLV